MIPCGLGWDTQFDIELHCGTINIPGVTFGRELLFTLPDKSQGDTTPPEPGVVTAFGS